MADVKLLVRQMKEAGMGQTDIIANLNELGIENAAEQVKAIMQETSDKGEGKQQDGIQITKIDSEGEKTVDIGKIINGGDEKQSELMKTVSRTDISDADALEDKLDQIIALLKALQELNKKVLETNRDLLVKLNKKQESEKPALGKIF